MPRPLESRKIIDAGIDQHTAGYLDRTLGQRAEGTLINTVFGVGSTSGVVVIEGAPTNDYAGTWAVLATITWAAENKVHETFISGSFLSRRARISTAIGGGGSVDVYALVTG